MFYDCHTHPLGHTGGSYTTEVLRPFVEQGIAKGLKGIAFTDHEWYYRGIDLAAVQALREEYAPFKILLGLEADYIPGREEELKQIISLKPYDFVIGSVHCLDGWEFDHPEYRERYQDWEINALYEKYFTLLAQAIDSGLFQLVGHLDLIKVFGYRYKGDLLPVVEPVLHKIKKGGLAVEINTNGLNKPVKEIYPEKEIIKRCCTLGIPLAISSDAHEPMQVGQYFEQLPLLLKKFGCSRLAYFQQKKLIWAEF